MKNNIYTEIKQISVVIIAIIKNNMVIKNLIISIIFFGFILTNSHWKYFAFCTTFVVWFAI